MRVDARLDGRMGQESLATASSRGSGRCGAPPAERFPRKRRVGVRGARDVLFAGSGSAGMCRRSHQSSGGLARRVGHARLSEIL
jgi:hypothetical protein